ncbi:MAG: hypothetical protein JW727_02525 [Candidatus Aenigmarchaeota archaeon]|nr:hypothetical protein [Candidatus Aenigmarchaeota archaeon]
MSILSKPVEVTIYPQDILRLPQVADFIGGQEEELLRIAKSLGRDALAIRTDVALLSGLLVLETRSREESEPVLSADIFSGAPNQDLYVVRASISGILDPGGQIYKWGEKSPEYCSVYLYPLLRGEGVEVKSLPVDNFGLFEPPFYAGCNFSRGNLLADCIVGNAEALESGLPGYRQYVEKNRRDFLGSELPACGSIFKGKCRYLVGLSRLLGPDSGDEVYVLQDQGDLIGLAKSVEIARLAKTYPGKSYELEELAKKRADVFLSGFRKVQKSALREVRDAWRKSTDEMLIYG